MPGGKIALYTGLINSRRSPDDELARGDGGHEIGSDISCASTAASVRATDGAAARRHRSSAFFAGVSEPSFPRPCLDVTLSLRNSRTLQETEADRIGVELAARSGIRSPRGRLPVPEDGQPGRGKPPEWASTHPSDQTRTQDVQSYAEPVHAPDRGGARAADPDRAVPAEFSGTS